MTRTARQALGAIVACPLGLTAITVIASFSRIDASAQTPATDRVPRIIDSLNDCVQERFKEVDERLGTARVTRPGAPHLFTPERLREQTVVEELERARMRVVLYLAGREVLKPKPDLSFHPIYITDQYFSNPVRRVAPHSIKKEDAIEWGVIKGPIRVTPVQRRKGAFDRLPNSIELWDETRNALQAFSRSESYDFGHGDWKFAARPIRVSDTACLNCHTLNGATLMSAGVRPDNALAIGDAIGVLLYGYRKLP